MSTAKLSLKKRASGVAAAGAVSLTCLLLAGCNGTSKVAEPFDDAAVSGHLTGSATVISMPDGFSNVAEKCDDKGDLIIVAFHGDDNRASVTAIRNPKCPGFVPDPVSAATAASAQSLAAKP